MEYGEIGILSRSNGGSGFIFATEDEKVSVWGRKEMRWDQDFVRGIDYRS